MQSTFLCSLGLCLFAAVLPLIGNAAETPPATLLAAKPGFIELKAGEAALTPLLQAELVKAKAQGRKPFVYFYADWCGPCKKLRASLAEPQMVDAFAGTYIIALNFDQWQSKIAATNFKIKGFPVFFALNDKAESTGRNIDGGAWGKDTPENMAGPLKAFFAK